MKGGEVIQLLRLVGSVVSKVIDVIEKDRKLKFEVKRGLEKLWRHMRMATREIQSSGDKNQGASHETKILLLKELALDIEDFIDGTWWVPDAYGLIFRAMGLDPHHQILEEINNFRESIERVRDWKPNHAGDERSQQDAVGVAAVDSAPPCNPEATIKTRAELILDWLLLPAAQGQPPDLKVISIVGRRGVGKTALARAVYDRYSESTEYKFVAWVVASECRNREDLRGKLLNKDNTTPHPGSTAASSQHVADGSSISHVEDTNLRHFLQDKRFLVVIDDVDHASERWLTLAIKDEFPDDGNYSRIIVTTSVHSIATECSRGCYVFRMHGLEETEAKDIFSKIVGPENNSPVIKLASDGILKKCGSLPLALSSAAYYLRRKGRARSCSTGGLTAEQCQCAARELGDMVLNGKVAEFVRINRTLLQCYNGLPDHIHRSCLLYASVFPRGRSINSKVAIRKWIAEGLVAANGELTSDQVANGCLDELIDHCIVDPVLISKDGVSKFRVYSIMLEFIIHKAVSQNFVALVDEGELLHNKEIVCASGQSTRGRPVFGVRVRRLSVQYSNEEAVKKAEHDIDLSAIRSLTIYRSHLFNMKYTKLLRVLDLGGCKGVKEIVCGSICKLHFLKYLSLRGTDVVQLPKEMQKLEYLETLDVRDIGVDVLPIPIEVIGLPFLAHLHGRFELPPGITREMLKRSKLQTLAGISFSGKIDNSFENIMLHARALENVKIYQATRGFSDSLPKKRAKKNSHPRDSARASTSKSSLSYLKGRLNGSNTLKTLSIDSSDLSTEFISFLEAPCAIKSIKLRGELDNLPPTVTLRELVGLRRLLLISTGLSIEDLSALQDLHYLEYLKLAEQSTGFWDGSFVVHYGGFPSLKRLCFEAQKLPQMILREGSLQSLTILDLLCPYPDNPELSVQGISNLSHLNEVILHHSTNDTKMRAWNDIVIWHKNRPSVKRQAKPQR